MVSLAKSAKRHTKTRKKLLFHDKDVGGLQSKFREFLTDVYKKGIYTVKCKGHTALCIKR